MNVTHAETQEMLAHWCPFFLLLPTQPLVGTFVVVVFRTELPSEEVHNSLLDMWFGCPSAPVNGQFTYQENGAA